MEPDHRHVPSHQVRCARRTTQPPGKKHEVQSLADLDACCSIALTDTQRLCAGLSYLMYAREISSPMPTGSAASSQPLFSYTQPESQSSNLWTACCSTFVLSAAESSQEHMEDLAMSVDLARSFQVVQRGPRPAMCACSILVGCHCRPL